MHNNNNKNNNANKETDIAAYVLGAQTVPYTSGWRL